jgi:hypothetical protein
MSSATPALIWSSLPHQHPCLPHADGGLHTRPQIEATIIHKGRLILPMHHYPGPGHRGQQGNVVNLLCAQCQGQTWDAAGAELGGGSQRRVKR